MPLAYEEFVDFMIAKMRPEEIIDFKPSERAKARVHELITRLKTEQLEPDETAELNHFLEMEHVMRLAKARARQQLPGG
jgi:hypothetical protein